jgi:hypothetical protein
MIMIIYCFEAPIIPERDTISNGRVAAVVVPGTHDLALAPGSLVVGTVVGVLERASTRILGIHWPGIKGS